jgi:hypothetical protein
MKRFLSLLVVLMAVPAGAVPVAAPGYALRAIPTPDTVQGGVVERDGVILVGQGGFGAGLQSIVRLDGDGVTTVATGFNALGGFDLDAAGTLYVVDNCGECAGATTGDTLYAIPNALTRTTPVTAAGQEVRPAGSIPKGQDVLVVSDGILVSNAVGVGTGTVVKVSGSTQTDLITGLDFTAGLALQGTTLLVGNVDENFAGEILRYSLAGASLGDPLVAGLSGTYAHVIDNDGLVLVSGGHPPDFSSSDVVAVAANGDVTTRADGFVFTTEMWFDMERDEALVLDSGVTQITAICRDGDGDGVCDADDGCPNGSVAITGAKLNLGKLAAPGGDDTLALKGEMMLAAPVDIDPLATGVRITVDGEDGRIVDAVIPAGAYDKQTKTGWKSKNGKSSYKNPAGIDGIGKVTIQVSTKTPGLVRFTVAGKSGDYILDLENVAPQLRATLLLGPEECGEVEFAGPAPAPACATKAAKGKVQCK